MSTQAGCTSAAPPQSAQHTPGHGRHATRPNVTSTPLPTAAHILSLDELRETQVHRAVDQGPQAQSWANLAMPFACSSFSPADQQQQKQVQWAVAQGPQTQSLANFATPFACSSSSLADQQQQRQVHWAGAQGLQKRPYAELATALASNSLSLAGRSRSEVARMASGSSSAAAGAVDGEPEYREPQEDLEGLMEYFDDLARRGMHFEKVTYVVNRWALGGVIPLWHHGLILQAGHCTFLTLDFSRRGILWDTFDLYPELPEDTFFFKEYCIHAEPSNLKSYCKETKPFFWFGNDCKHWALGMLKVMGITEYPLAEKGALRKPGPAENPPQSGQKPEQKTAPTCMAWV